MEYLHSIPLEKALELAKTLLQDADTLVETGTALLSRAAFEERGNLRKILQCLTSYSHPHPILTEKLLELLTFCEDPLVVVHQIPQLIGHSEEEVELVLNSFSVLSQNREYVVPIIGMTFSFIHFATLHNLL